MSSACRRPAPAATLLLATLVLVLAACAGAPARREAYDPAARAPQGAAGVPDRPAGFTLVSSQHYDDPMAGSTWRYAADSHPELLVDALVYPAAGIWPDDEAAGNALAAIMRSEIGATVEAGMYEAAEVIREGRIHVTRPDGELPGRHLRMALTKDGMELISHAHLFYLPPYTVKVRSTFPAYGNTSFDARLKSLVEAFVGGVAIDKAVLCRPLEVHVAPPGTTGWVAKDGADLVVAADAGEAVIADLLIESTRRALSSGCARAGSAGAVPAGNEQPPGPDPIRDAGAASVGRGTDIRADPPLASPALGPRTGPEAGSAPHSVGHDSGHRPLPLSSTAHPP